MPKQVNRHPGIEKRGEKWRARVFLNGKEKCKTFSTQEEAFRWKRETERALEKGEWIDPAKSSISFAEWSKKWIEGKSNISAQTLRGYKSQITTHLIPAFGKYPLSSINHSDINLWVTKKYNGGTSATIIRRNIVIMSQIFDAAILDGRIFRNPTNAIKTPRIVKVSKQALSVNQLKQLAKACGNFSSLILFAGITGLRWGELSALRVKDVSLLNKVIRVDRAITTGSKGEKIVGPTKTLVGRSVPLPKELIKDIEALMICKSSDDFLFSMPSGGMLDYNNFMSRVFRPAIKSLGLDGISFHSLRHTSASLLIATGAPITAVSNILGHSSTKMTLDVYGHWYENESSKYIDRMSASVFEAGTDKERTDSLSLIISS